MADGVYTETQATRGAAVYDAACAGCHRADLGGGTGPALKEQRFAREFAGKDLKTLFTKSRRRCRATRRQASPTTSISTSWRTC